MKVEKQIQKPKNWQDFQRLCKNLYGEIWSCKDIIKMHGRNGQPQCGVDVYVNPKGTGYWGIQCKGKDEYTHKQLTKEEIDEEVSRAINFKPNLKKFFFATTANCDTKIEEYVRIKSERNLAQGLFPIHVKFWDDIVQDLEDAQSTLNWYLGIAGYYDNYGFDLSFGNSRKQVTISPKIEKYIVRYRKPVLQKNSISLWQKIKRFCGYREREEQLLKGDDLFPLINPELWLPQVSESFCDVLFELKNIGTCVLEDLELYLTIEEDKCNDFRLTDFAECSTFDIEGHERVARKTGIRRMGKNLYYTPVDNKPLVQNVWDSFRVSFEPKASATPYDFTINWLLQSRNFETRGDLKIKVSPIIEEVVDYKFFLGDGELPVDDISYRPKKRYIKPNYNK